MSEYWKSVPRKFCEFCKCWITDNKPSVEFHERGKRHKENVELKLKEVRKKSLQQSRDDDQLKAQMDKMEEAALEAFKKDLKDNPALAAQYGVSLEPKPKPETAQKEETASSYTTEQGAGDKEDKKAKKRKKAKATEWYEAKSPEGYSYYWNTKTGESKWEAPEEYMSLAEQKAMEEEQSTQPTSSNSTNTKETISESEAKQSEAKPKEESAIVSSGPVISGSARSAYGAWGIVREVERPQLYDETSVAPALDEIPLPVQESVKEEPEVKKPKIKEKIVTLGPSTGGPVAFKKRKIGGARNVRQKTDND